MNIYENEKTVIFGKNNFHILFIWNIFLMFFSKNTFLYNYI